MTDLHGVIDGLDEAEYHAHPALSASGAKRLLPPSCPAKFKWERDNGRPPKRDFDFGHAAHKEVLGVGGDIVIVQKTAKDGATSDADDYKTKSAQDHRDEIRAAGKVPLLADEAAVVREMADAIRAHPIASALFDPERGGKPEQSLFWHDDRHGVDRRVRFDWLPDVAADGRLIVPDLKTTKSSEPRAFARDVFNYGYPVQAVFYMDGLRDLELADDVAFVFVAIEKTAPYLITIHELDPMSLLIAREQVDRALSVFADCSATDTWPGYSTDVELITPPAWATYQFQELTA